MTQQVYIIGGGEVFRNYNDYLNYLRQYKIKEIEEIQHRDWKINLKEDLGESFEIIFPKMPCKQNANFLEWKIWMEKYFPFLRKDIILIGHSLGGSFWLKYLSECSFPFKIKQLHLVATPIEENENFLGEFLPKKIDNINKLTQNIFLYYSQNDPVVPFSNLKNILLQLPNAKQFVFQNRGHFRMEHFPELIQEIKSSI